MLAAFARLLLSLGVPARFARRLAIVLVLLALLIALWIGKALYDRRLIAAHDATVAASDAASGRVADRAVATQRRADDQRLAAETHELEKVTADAPSAPDAITRRRAYYECVRAQQSARQRGEPTPAC